MTDAQALMAMTHRGARYGYLWSPYSADPDAHGTSLWFDVAEGIPEPPEEWEDVYYGVHGCHTRGGERQRAGRDAWRLGAANCLYADFDNKSFDNGIDGIIRWLEYLVCRSVLFPTAIVKSGGGAHAYWGLDQTVNLRHGDNLSRMARAQRIWVDEVVKSDPNAKDLNRVLRLAGSFNHKYDPPQSVEIIEFSPWRTYPLSYLGELLEPYIKLDEERERQRREAAQEAAKRAPTAWSRLVQWAGEDAKQGARHNTALRLAFRLKEAGCPESTAEELVNGFVEKHITDRETRGEARGAVRYAYR